MNLASVLASKREQLKQASIRATEARRILESDDWKFRVSELQELIYDRIEQFAPEDSSNKAVFILGMLRQTVNELRYPVEAINLHKKLQTEVIELDTQLKANPKAGENLLNHLLD